MGTKFNKSFETYLFAIVRKAFNFQIKSRTRMLRCFFELLIKNLQIFFKYLRTMQLIIHVDMKLQLSRALTLNSRSIVYMVAAELRRRPTSKSANSARLRESFARLEFRHDGIEGTRIPGVRANVKTHLVHPHEHASGHVLARTYALAFAHMRSGFLWSDQ